MCPPPRKIEDIISQVPSEPVLVLGHQFKEGRFGSSRPIVVELCDPDPALVGAPQPGDAGDKLSGTDDLLGVAGRDKKKLIVVQQPIVPGDVPQEGFVCSLGIPQVGLVVGVYNPDVPLDAPRSSARFGTIRRGAGAAQPRNRRRSLP